MLKGIWTELFGRTKRYKGTLLWGRIGFDGDDEGARSELRTPGPHKNLELKLKANNDNYALAAA